ncbi:hypothetical protein D3C86_969980 [compost metagenome]
MFQRLSFRRNCLSRTWPLRNSDRLFSPPQTAESFSCSQPHGICRHAPHTTQRYAFKQILSTYPALPLGHAGYSLSNARSYPWPCSIKLTRCAANNGSVYSPSTLRISNGVPGRTSAIRRIFATWQPGRRRTISKHCCQTCRYCSPCRPGSTNLTLTVCQRPCRWYVYSTRVSPGACASTPVLRCLACTGICSVIASNKWLGAGRLTCYSRQPNVG